jgi:hypothetical protein
MYYTRAALFAVLFLGGAIGSAQTTVIRIAPPPPVWSVSPPGGDTSW